MPEYWIVGEAQKNPDGKSRQRIIAQHRSAGTEIALVREPENRYDGNAVAVYLKGGGQIGYLSREDAPEVAARLDSGEAYECWVSRVQGGTKEKPSYGIVIDLHFEGDLDEGSRRVQRSRPGLLGQLARLLLGR